MFTRPTAHRLTLSVWARVAAFLSFVAVLSALMAPLSMLAQDVASGQLSGVCHFNAAPGNTADTGSADAPAAGAHCDLCAGLGWTLPPLAVMAIPCFAGHGVVAANFPADVAVTIAGLPFSRGPPILL